MRFDFDEMQELYKKNPAGFEEKRKELINELIQSSPPEIRDSLTSFQSEIDEIIKKFENPLDASAELIRQASQGVKKLLAIGRKAGISQDLNPSQAIH